MNTIVQPQHLPATAPPAPSPAREASPRYHELDWLRVLIILALVPSHALGLFTTAASQFLGTGYTSPIGLSTLVTLGTWGIALLFLVAGASARFSLTRRTTGQYIRERCVRLLVPFVFASLILIPLQDYIIVRTFPGVMHQMALPAGWDPHLADSPVAFYLWYLRAHLFFLTHYAPQQEVVFWGQLWFIPRLLVISLLALPLMLFVRSARGVRIIASLGSRCERWRGAVFLFAVPLGLVLALFGWQWQVWQVQANPDTINVLGQLMFYGVAFVYGYVLYANERLRWAVRRDGGVASLVLGTLAFVITQLPGLGNPALARDYSASGLLAALLRALAAWLCILAVVGLSMRFIAFSSRLGRYLAEASYPFYVLHLTVLYLVGLPFLARGTPALLAFVVMVALTYATTLATYELFIRRIGLMRVLFGIRKRPMSVPA